MSNAKTPSKVDPADYIYNEFLAKHDPDSQTSSSMFDVLFVPANRVPKEISERLDDEEQREKILKLEEALYSSYISKPYWEKGRRLLIEEFNNVVLADDRSMLDKILGHGSVMDNADKYTLRAWTEAMGLKDVDWKAYPNKDRIDKPLHNFGTYVHIPVKDLAKAQRKQLNKDYRERTKERIRRLYNMMVRMTPEIDGQLLFAKQVEFSILNRDVHYLLDRSKMKGNDYNDQTYTDIVVNVSDIYINSLEKDGIISRTRLLNHYQHLCGPNNIEDFYKSLDSHKREFLHGKNLSYFVFQYLEGKISTFNINRAHKAKQIFNQVVDNKDKLVKHFNIRLQATDDKSKFGKSKEHVLLYIPLIERK